MQTYRVNVVIQSVDGPDDHSEVCLGNVQADCITSLVAHASTLGPSFVKALAASKEAAITDYAVRSGVDPAELACQP